MTMTTYIVVADAARARIFTRDALHLAEQESLVHAAGRLQGPPRATKLLAASPTGWPRPLGGCADGPSGAGAGARPDRGPPHPR